MIHCIITLEILNLLSKIGVVEINWRSPIQGIPITNLDKSQEDLP